MQVHFYFEKKSDLHLIKMQICFYFEKKKSDLHLIKMQIYFGFEKKSDLHLIKLQICFGFKKNNCSHADYRHSRKRLKKLHINNHALNKKMINSSCYK